MELTILGSGCGIPSLQRNAPGLLININDEPLVFDGGPGTLVRLLEVGVDYKKLKHVFYTHGHSDHSGDLVPLIQALWTTPGFVRVEPLNIYGPPGFEKFVKILAEAYGSWVYEPGYPLMIKDLQRDRLQFTDFYVETRPMQHSLSAIAYRIDDKSGRSIVYSGDTAFNDEIIELSRGADVLVLECSFPENTTVPGHLTPSTAGRIAAEAECKHLILTHFYPPYDKLENEINRIVPKLFSGELTLAQDFMKIIV